MANTNKTMNTTPPEMEYKRRYNLAEMYRSFVLVPGAILKIIADTKKQRVDGQFRERLQLAVTEVNGCAACSYAHTHLALKQGMSRDEISSFLSGDNKFVKPQEAKAIFFAQHFADSGGYPGREAYTSIVQEYGVKKARIILAAIQVMMAANIYGIPFSALYSRLKGKTYKGSSLFYELGMLIAGGLLLPPALVHAMARGLTGRTGQQFNQTGTALAS